VVEVDGEPLGIEVAIATPDRVVVVADGVRRSFSVATFGDEIYVDSPQANVVLHALARFPRAVDELAAGSLVAPMPGTVVRKSPRGSAPGRCSRSRPWWAPIPRRQPTVREVPSRSARGRPARSAVSTTTPDETGRMRPR
jgi:hypothetical protein